MPYKVGAKGSYGCSGYPAVKEGTNEVMGCHKTRAEAAAQIYAINRSEGNIDKSMGAIKEGDFVMGMTKEGMIHGMVEHIMIEGGTLGTPGSEYALESMPPENPAMSVRIYEEEEDGWEPTAYSIGMMYKDAEVIDINNHSMENESNGMDAYDNSIGKSHSCNTTSALDKAYEGCGCPTCKELNVNCENCPVCIANSYMSDDEDMDKWNNIEKKCWVGYTQQGMKDKNGRMVPNCVPVGKSEDMDDEMEKAKKPNYSEIIEPRRGGSTPSNPKLYAAVVQAAKDKFDVYPSAVANSWVVQEYKRRGGTYKSDSMPATKSIWDGLFDPKGFMK
jgi:hypothetical protein